MTICDQLCLCAFNKPFHMKVRCFSLVMQIRRRETHRREGDRRREATVGQREEDKPSLPPWSFLDESGILRVGGRIRQACISLEVKHPIILPRNEHITRLIIKYFHEKTEHQGRGFTLNEIRSSGYWIVGAARLSQIT